MTEDELKALLQESYKEVLDATKHQDDKIGRFLTAIAFLTGGALVFVNKGVLGARYAVGGQAVPLPSIALAMFLGLVVISVLEFILALSTPLTLPRPPSKERQSRLFFLAIAGETEDSWSHLWKDVDLAEKVRDDYRYETRNIANRADRKYAKSTEAAALFVASLLFFALVVVLSIDVLTNSPASAQPALQTSGASSAGTSALSTSPASAGSVASPLTLPWNSYRRLIVGAVVAVFALALSYQTVESSRKLDPIVQAKGHGSNSDVKKARKSVRRARFLWLVPIGYPLFSFFTVAPASGASPWRPAAVMVSGTCVVLALTLQFALADPARILWALISGIISTVIVILAVASVVSRTEWGELFVAIVAPILILIPNITHSASTFFRRVQYRLSQPNTD